MIQINIHNIELSWDNVNGKHQCDQIAHSRLKNFHETYMNQQLLISKAQASSTIHRRNTSLQSLIATKALHRTFRQTRVHHCHPSGRKLGRMFNNTKEHCKCIDRITRCTSSLYSKDTVGDCLQESQKHFAFVHFSSKQDFQRPSH